MEAPPVAAQRVGLRQEVERGARALPQSEHLRGDEEMRHDGRRGGDEEEAQREPAPQLVERAGPIEREEEDRKEPDGHVGGLVGRIEERAVHGAAGGTGRRRVEHDARAAREREEEAAPERGREEIRPGEETHGAAQATHSGTTRAGSAPISYPRSRKRRTASRPFSP